MYQIKIEKIVERTEVPYWLATMKVAVAGKVETILAEGDSQDQAVQLAMAEAAKLRTIGTKINYDRNRENELMEIVKSTRIIWLQAIKDLRNYQKNKTDEVDSD